jgi:hypothetical protein
MLSYQPRFFNISLKIKNFPLSTVSTAGVDETEIKNGNFLLKLQYVCQKMDVVTNQYIIQHS